MLKKNCLAAFVVLAFVALLPESVLAACGEILVSKGDVKVENGKDKSVKAAPQGTKVCQGDTVIAGAQSRAKVKMEDGNELNISPDSKIMLESYEYKAADNKKKVLLNVLYGKVRAATREENMYNDKAADGQANTFQVKTKSAVAGVRGTDFLTSFDAKSSKTEIVTFKGNVAVGTPGPGGAILNAVSVGAGQKTEALPGAPPAPPKAVPAAEMNKMNSETKGDSAAAKSPGAAAGGQAATEEKKRDPSSEQASGDKKSPDKQPEPSAPPERKPASPMPGPPPPPPPPPMPPGPPKLPDVIFHQPNPLVNQTVESGPGKVNITITIPQ